MKTKTLALFSGIVGLVGGILLLVGPFFIIGTAAATASSDATAGSIILLNALKIVNLVLGIIAIVYYKGDERVGVAPSVLLIVGGAVALIPFLGWIGGIIVLMVVHYFLVPLKNLTPINQFYYYY